MKTRYVLRDRNMLRKVMSTPGRGRPYTIRELAAATGVSRGKVGHLLSGRTARCDIEDAHAIAEALDVGVLVLFAPSMSLQPRKSSTTHDMEE